MLVLYTRAQLARQEGQALVEYALIISLIAIVSVVIVTALGTQVSGIFSEVSAKI